MSDRQRVEFPCVRGCVWPEHTEDDPRPRPAKRGQLCNRCYYGLERAVAELPSMHSELIERLQPGDSGAGPYVTGSPSHPLPIDPRVAAHRSRIADLLTSWARMVAEERQEVGPINPQPETTATYLVARVDWCASQPWVDDLVTEMQECRSRAFSLLFPSGRRRIPVANACPESTVGTDGLLYPCPGTLTASVGDEGDPLVVECSEDEEHVWGAVQWRSLGRKLGRTLPDEFDRQAEALALGLSQRQVRRLRAAGTLDERMNQKAS